MNFQTAVGPEIENARDVPNAPGDRQALGLVKPYQGMVAWPTVFLAIGIVTAFILVIALAVAARALHRRADHTRTALHGELPVS